MDIVSSSDGSVACDESRDGGFIDNHVGVIDKVFTPPSFLGVALGGVRGGEIPDVIKWARRLVYGATAEGGDHGDVVKGKMVVSVRFPT